MSFLHRFSAISVMAASSLLLMFSACGDETSGPAGTCEPGTNVFCRCPGGEAGTRECLDNGEDFDDCLVAPETPCGERVECTPDSSIFCLCPNGDEGTKDCLRDGTGYAECMIGPDEVCPRDTSSGGGNVGGSGGAGGEGGGTPGMCAHDLCASGDALKAACDPCATTICDNDDYCCTTAWDSYCVADVDTLCDNLCNPVVMCVQDVCTESLAQANPDGCDPCVSEVCATDDACCITDPMDDFFTGWDSLCVAHVKDSATHPACAHLCCDHNECVEGGKLDENCSLCAAEVCMLDSWCCNNEWDQFCVTKAEAEPSCQCN